MAFWLVKTEPNDYSFEDLAKDKNTPWEGVKNALALQNLRKFKKGDQVLIYHTGSVKAAVGLAKVIRGPYAPLKRPKECLVDLAAVKALKYLVSLKQIKADPAFKGFDLLRIGRLSVLEVPSKMWKRILSLASKE